MVPIEECNVETMFVWILQERFVNRSLHELSILSYLQICSWKIHVALPFLMYCLPTWSDEHGLFFPSRPSFFSTIFASIQARRPISLPSTCPPTPNNDTSIQPPSRGSHLSGNTIKVLSQHPSHVLPGMGRHLMLQKERKLAAFTDAVEMAINLVVLATWVQKRDQHHILTPVQKGLKEP